mmetsp:Transcript_9769/g.32704  ORF Transcript_9769/g.32704 Transcript_9769/m.32704 type:complete len:231 (+) Transcript_9769:239-931(+)
MILLQASYHHWHDVPDCTQHREQPLRCPLNFSRNTLEERGEGGAEPALSNDVLEEEEGDAVSEAVSLACSNPEGDGKDAADSWDQKLLSVVVRSQSISKDPSKKGGEDPSTGDDKGIGHGEFALRGREKLPIQRSFPNPNAVACAEPDGRGCKQHLDGGDGKNSFDCLQPFPHLLLKVERATRCLLHLLLLLSAAQQHRLLVQLPTILPLHARVSEEEGSSCSEEAAQRS